MGGYGWEKGGKVKGGITGKWEKVRGGESVRVKDGKWGRVEKMEKVWGKG
jgi:hypothetical protein